MTFRVLIRKQGEAYEAWAPELHGCKVIGPSETATMRRLREKVRAEFADQENAESALEGWTERSLDVEIDEQNRSESTPADVVSSPVENVRMQFTAGIALTLLGLTGVFFSFWIARIAEAPALLFAPIMVAAFGVLGIVMGLAGAGRLHHGN